VKKNFILFLLALVSFIGCQMQAPVKTGVLDRSKLVQIDAAINSSIAAGRIPGAVVWVEHEGDIYTKAYGKRSLVPTVEDETLDTIFDVASISKVMGGTPAIMKLYEQGRVNLDAPISTYIPEYTNDTGKITLRNLLTHTSGFPGDISTHPVWHGTETAIKMAAAVKLQSAPGSRFVYSDINLFTVGEIVHRVSGLTLDKFNAKEIYGPLKMIDTGYNPPASKIPRIAPTQMVDANGESSTRTNDIMLRGIVHDPTSRFMGGVAGHAGVFTTAADMARYARMMLNYGELDGVRIFEPETVKTFTAMQSDLPGRRGLGWDVDSTYASPRGSRDGAHFPLGSYGHTGFTGCAFWIDPFSKTFYIFLSNHVHPYGGTGAVTTLYRQIGTITASAVTDFDWSTAPGEPARPAIPPQPGRTNAATAALAR
jgi:CubicO group peptidase (beta-lactamase class C family)